MHMDGFGVLRGSDAGTTAFYAAVQLAVSLIIIWQAYRAGRTKLARFLIYLTLWWLVILPMPDAWPDGAQWCLGYSITFLLVQAGKGLYALGYRGWLRASHRRGYGPFDALYAREFARRAQAGDGLERRLTLRWRTDRATRTVDAEPPAYL